MLTSTKRMPLPEGIDLTIARRVLMPQLSLRPAGTSHYGGIRPR